MQFLTLGLALLALFSLESSYAVAQTTVTKCTATKTITATPKTSTVTKCTATKTNITTRTVSKTITKAITTTLVKTQLKTATATVTQISTSTLKSTTTSTKTLTSTLKTTVVSTKTTTTTLTSTTTTTQKSCMPTQINVLQNGGFEHELDGWDWDQSAGRSLSTRCDRDPAWVSFGQCAVAALYADPNTKAMLISRIATFCPGYLYVIKFQVKITGTCGLELFINGLNGGEISAGSPAQWLPVRYKADIPFRSAASVDLEVKFMFRSGTAGGCGVSLDEITIEAISESDKDFLDLVLQV